MLQIFYKEKPIIISDRKSDLKNSLIINPELFENLDLLKLLTKKRVNSIGIFSNEYEFMKVITSGYLKFENTMYFFRSNLNGASGFELIVPMQTEENKFIYVILGWIPYDIKQNFDISSLDNFDLFEAEGALIYSKERKPLIPQNDYDSNVWYLMNTEEMDQYHKISSSRYLIKLLDQTRFQNLLIEFEPSNITNNHLQYAVTWFLLSIVITVMYMYYIRRGAKKDEL